MRWHLHQFCCHQAGQSSPAGYDAQQTAPASGDLSDWLSTLVHSPCSSANQPRAVLQLLKGKSDVCARQTAHQLWIVLQLNKSEGGVCAWQTGTEEGHLPGLDRPQFYICHCTAFVAKRTMVPW